MTFVVLHVFSRNDHVGKIQCKNKDIFQEVYIYVIWDFPRYGMNLYVCIGKAYNDYIHSCTINNKHNYNCKIKT